MINVKICGDGEIYFIVHEECGVIPCLTLNSLFCFKVNSQALAVFQVSKWKLGNFLLTFCVYKLTVIYC